MQPHSAMPPHFFLRVDSPRPASGGCWASSETGLLGSRNASGRVIFLFFFLEKIEGLALHFFLPLEKGELVELEDVNEK